MKDQKYINRFIQLVRNYQDNKKHNRIQTQSNRQAQFNKLTNVINSTFYPHKTTNKTRRLNTNIDPKQQHIKLPSSIKLVYLESQKQSTTKKKRKYQAYKQFLIKRNSDNKQEILNKEFSERKQKMKKDILRQKKTNFQLELKDQMQSNQLKKTQMLFRKANYIATSPQKQDKLLSFNKDKNIISLDGTSLNFRQIKPLYKTNYRQYNQLFKTEDMELTKKPLYQILKTISPVKRREKILQAHEIFIGIDAKSNHKDIKRQTIKQNKFANNLLSPAKLEKYKHRRESQNGNQQRISGWEND